MNVNYDIYIINNASGQNKTRKYVQLKQADPMTETELQKTIQSHCSLTKGDVAAVLTELHDIVIREFAMGRRVYIPGLGYFSMSAEIDALNKNSGKKITGKEIRLRRINFRPEKGIMSELKRSVCFVRTKRSSKSNEYTENQIVVRMKEYLRKNRFITCSIMRRMFGLTQYTAQKWLNLFVEKNVILKDGTRRFPIYFLNAKDEERSLTNAD